MQYSGYKEVGNERITTLTINANDIRQALANRPAWPTWLGRYRMKLHLPANKRKSWILLDYIWRP